MKSKKRNKTKKTGIVKDTEKNAVKKDIDNKTITKSNNTKKVVVVHGWEGDINKGWFPWLKKTLESQGFKVLMEQMPDSDKPQVEVWMETLKNICGNVDEQTYFVGHSIGCQAILRMLEKHESQKAGGAVFLAGWLNLKEYTYTEEPELEKMKRKIIEPWIMTEIDFSRIQPKFLPGKVTAIFSDNDPYVDISNAEVFKQKLGARILIETNKGHYEEGQIEAIPLLVEELLRISSGVQKQNID
jgi:uncharacterized protein